MIDSELIKNISNYDIYLNIQNMETAIMIHKLVWSLVIEGECQSLYIRIKDMVYILIIYTSSIFLAAYATYLQPG